MAKTNYEFRLPLSDYGSIRATLVGVLVVGNDLEEIKWHTTGHLTTNDRSHESVEAAVESVFPHLPFSEKMERVGKLMELVAERVRTAETCLDNEWDLSDEFHPSNR